MKTVKISETKTSETKSKLNKAQEIANKIKETSKNYYRASELENVKFEIQRIEKGEGQYGDYLEFFIQPEKMLAGSLTLSIDKSRSAWHEFFEAGGNLLEEFGLFSIKLVPAKVRGYKPYVKLIPLGNDDQLF